MRRNSRGTIIYVLFGILIAVFVINFGPGSQGCSGAMGKSFAARISGVDVSEPEFRLYYIAKVGNRFDARIARQYRMKEILMDKVIERELLAQEAEKLGFAVSAKEAEDLVKTGKMMLLGREEPWADVSDGFDYKHLRQLAENTFGVNVAKFIEVQKRELLADRVRQLMAGATKISPAEAKESYEQRERQANLEFVRFSPRQHDADIEVTPAEVDAYVKAHGDELKKAYEERAFLYKKLDKQARVRRILAAVGKDEADAAKVAAAQRKAEKARKQLEAKVEFAKVAKESSDDEATRARGGDMGWHKQGYLGLGADLEKKVFAAKAGDLIGPERTDQGFEVLQVVGFREGDVAFEAVAGELAEDRIRTEAGKAKAKAAADQVMAKLKGGAKLEALFPKHESQPDAEAQQDQKPSEPQITETGLFSRKGELVPQVGVSKEVMEKAFTLKPGEVAGPFEVSGAYVVLQVKERREPDMQWFEKHQADELRAMERQKWADIVDGWTKQKCSEVAADGRQAPQEGQMGRIKWSTEVISYETPGDTAYVPCSPNRM